MRQGPVRQGPLRQAAGGGLNPLAPSPEPRHLGRCGEEKPGALAGVRVLDLTTIIMGPYATQILGDYGADVIKVENPEGDIMRFPGPGRSLDMGHVFLHVNRNKRSIVLDLKSDPGRSALLDLARQSDVLVYNIRPQAMQRLRLGYEDLRAVNPRIIYAGCFGFGQDGPYATRAAYDDLIQAMSGAADLLGRHQQGPPRFVPINFCDRVSGLHMVNVVLAALFARERLGRGQSVEVPMFETMAAFVLGEHFGGDSFVPSLGEMGYARIVSPHRRPHPTRDGYLCVLPYNDRQWEAFLKAADREDLLEDPRFVTQSARAAHVSSMYALIGEEVARYDNAEWRRRLAQADLPWTFVIRLEDLAADPHLKAVGMFQEFEHPTEGRIRETRISAHWSETPGSIRRLAPRKGEHSREVFEEAGFAPERIALLLEAQGRAIP
jgi:crotonobetainyl-CoA:carnitine CoA-transferase CaiB-like acyl-CoA transferase